MKKATFGILALLLIGIVAAGAVSALGMGKWGGNKEAVRDAIQAKDFAAWKAAMTADLTEERFNQIVERQENMPEGSREGRLQMMGQHEEMEAALSAGDFDAWKALMEEKPCFEGFELTEEVFEQMAKVHAAAEAGDMEQAIELKKELGFPACGKEKFGEGKHGGFGDGRHNIFGEKPEGCAGGCGGCPYAK